VPRQWVLAWPWAGRQEVVRLAQRFHLHTTSVVSAVVVNSSICVTSIGVWLDRSTSTIVFSFQSLPCFLLYSRYASD